MTAGVGHAPRLDVLSLQDHRLTTASGDELAIHLRAAVLAGRVRARDQFGRFVVEGGQGDESGSERSVGDLGLGSVLWPALNNVARKIPAWFFCAPAVTTEPSRDLRPAPTVTEPGKSTTRPNPQTESRGTRSDLAAQRVRVRPIGREDFAEDNRFRVLDPALSPNGAPLPKGWPGVVISTTQERVQREVFLPAGGGMLVAVNYGSTPEVGSQVFDTDASGALDQARKARLQSAMRIARIGLGAIAWQLTNSERDSLDGYGLTVGRGVVVTTGPPETTPPSVLSGPTATGGPGGRIPTTGGTGFQVGGAVDLSTLETPPRIDGQAGGIVVIDPATGRPKPPVGTTVVRPGTPPPPNGTSDPTVDRPSTPVVGASLVYAYASSERGGPLQVGCAGDKHEVGRTLDGEPINAEHLNPLAPWFMDPVRDGPIEFDRQPYSRPSAQPYRARAWLRWDPDYVYPFGAETRRGGWRFESEASFRVEILDPPPPKKPPPPPDPPKPPPFIEPGPWHVLTGPRIATPGGTSPAPFVELGQGKPPIPTGVGSAATGGAGTGVRSDPQDSVTPPFIEPGAGTLLLDALTDQSIQDALGTRTPNPEGLGTNVTGGTREATSGGTGQFPSGAQCLLPKSDDKTGMGPENKPKQYVSTGQSVIFGGGTYSRAQATARGSANLSTRMATGSEVTSKAEIAAPLVHHEAVIGAGGTQDWCRWQYEDRGSKSRHAVAKGGPVELPPDVTAADYLAGKTSPTGLTATRYVPPGYAQIAYADVDPATGAPSSGAVTSGTAGGSLVVEGVDDDGAALAVVELDGADGIVRMDDLDGATPAAGRPGYAVDGDAFYGVQADGTKVALGGGGTGSAFPGHSASGYASTYYPIGGETIQDTNWGPWGSCRITGGFNFTQFGFDETADGTRFMVLTADTYLRAFGAVGTLIAATDSWITDGWLVGMQAKLSGSANNNGYVTVLGVTTNNIQFQHRGLVGGNEGPFYSTFRIVESVVPYLVQVVSDGRFRLDYVFAFNFEDGDALLLWDGGVTVPDGAAFGPDGISINAFVRGVNVASPKEFVVGAFGSTNAFEIELFVYDPTDGVTEIGNTTFAYTASDTDYQQLSIPGSDLTAFGPGDVVRFGMRCTPTGFDDGSASYAQSARVQINNLRPDFSG